MASFIQNMLWNSVSGFVEEGKRTVGGYAGDALIKAGDLVENGGRGIGNGKLLVLIVFDFLLSSTVSSTLRVDMTTM